MSRGAVHKPPDLNLELLSNLLILLVPQVTFNKILFQIQVARNLALFPVNESLIFFSFKCKRKLNIRRDPFHITVGKMVKKRERKRKLKCKCRI